MKPVSLLQQTVMFAIAACAPIGPYASSQAGPLSVTQFVRDAKSLAGETVTVRGFLVSLHPDLALYVDESLPSTREVPIAIVEDIELRAKTPRGGSTYGESFFLEGLGCTSKYADVTGVAGETIRGTYGITKIVSVRTFVNSSFSDPGTECFSQ